ncbi:alpha/beta-hydrolase [Pholiota conissans]|uniref:Alpha/beta-hydrolase n=1 Tax=Pholiota conissans TaxID=109636 RepID=A0A9P5Z536_9AGAR|nr:alpha/beta-hydrolase [Pholiota conissans]
MSSAPSSSSAPHISTFPTAFPDTTCLQRGLCPVTSLRAQGPEVLESHSLYYEQHGPPSVKGDLEAQKKLHRIVFIMGLNSSSFSWGPQVRWFGHGGEHGNCTALVFDNRGVGNSGYPRGPYSTTGMAEDVICLLDYLGWTKERELTIVGISLGGMIAQEVAYRIPKRISALILAVTTPGGPIWGNFPPHKGLVALTKLLFTPDPVKKVPTVLDMLFPPSWLAERAKKDPHAEFNGNTPENDQGKTNYDVQAEGFIRRVAITKPQLLLGHVSQMVAALTHNVSDARLAYIAANVPKVTIVTGDDDHLVHPSGSVRIKKAMDGAPNLRDASGHERVELVQWVNTGHGIHAQREEEFNSLVERSMREGRAILEGGFKGRDV